MKNQVAQTILAQLGGNMFVMMTGAKKFMSGADSLQMTLPSNFATAGINRVEVKLMADDTYRVTFGKLRGVNYKVIAQVHNVYADDLRAVFTERTGLDVSMGRILRA